MGERVPVWYEQEGRSGAIRQRYRDATLCNADRYVGATALPDACDPFPLHHRTVTATRTAVDRALFHQ